MTREPDVERWGNPLFSRAGSGQRQQWRGLLKAFRDGELIIPPYQRGRVWTDRQAAEWAGFVLSQAPSPALFVRLRDVDNRIRDELVDGQQRITALDRWLRGEIDAILPWSGRLARCEGRNEARMLYRLTVPVITLPLETTDREAIEAYITLNTGGVPHTDEDIAHARSMLGAPP